MEIDLSSGRYVVDAKSIMGIFSLDLMNEITLTAHSDNTEKLFEELLLNTEGIEKTPNDLIFIGHPSKVSKEELLSHLEVLRNAEKMTQEEIRDEIHSVVKEFNDENARVTA